MILVDVLRFIVLYSNFNFNHAPVIQLPAIGYCQCKFLITPSASEINWRPLPDKRIQTLPGAHCKKFK